MTEILLIFSDKQIKPGERTIQLSRMILTGRISVGQLLHYASGAKDPQKATCIEVFEFVSACQPGLITTACFEFVIVQLKSKAPRVKWESARVIANTARLYPDMLDEAVANLVEIAEHTGTVVRWSAAHALSAILKLNTELNLDLIPRIEEIMEKEEKSNIRKMYEKALKQSL